MLEDNKKIIGLSWEPKLPSLLFGAKSGSQDVHESSLVYKPNSELIDGLFVPPNDPKKVNKLLKKEVDLEYFTSRLTKREREATLADELLSDQSLKVYRKRKVREIEEKSQPVGVDKWKIKGKSSWKCAKQRTH
ncbi:unnamed protein product [Lactuca saligna]|uniref:Uncharacterized protein n=1 Tax=Lactuca saligna TaxID=75948 RepID=A0AA35ZEV6_LACSI|nr:unnamed protein product [Lactuca saligna]